MLRIGVLGVGHLGKIHIKCINLVEDLELVGFFDPNEENAKSAMAQYNIHRFESFDALLDAVDAVDIVTPTVTHFELAKKAIKKGKHVFIEKPITETPTQAKELLELMQKHQVKVQVGHVERFNPAMLALDEASLNPMFIEVHRLATFNPRGTDVSVVLDLMIHDLDIILNLVKSPVKSVHATGVSVVSSTADLSNARIEFENGCIANVTASRLSLKQMRKVRLFQKDGYISLDFLTKKAEVVRLYDISEKENLGDKPVIEIDTEKGKKLLQMEIPEIKPVNSIEMELATFTESIINDTVPKVTLEDGYRALALAYEISAQITAREETFL
ncbi:MAG: putative dehydrogenase [Cognaticolwellia sp.]|jgi:predicted dehydrogenase